MKRLRIPEHGWVFAGFFIFFLFLLVANFSGPHDSIGYLNGIVRGNPLFHQHHLLYHFTAHYWLVFTQAIFPGIKDYYLVETFTAVWGSASLAVVYCFFRYRFKQAAWMALLGTFVIAFSYGMWFYSINIEVYAPPIFFLLLTLYLLTSDTFSDRDVWKVALLHAFAILFHQVHVLFTIILLYVLWRRRARLNLFKAVLQYAVIGAVLVGGAYFIVGWVIEGQNSLAKWTNWMEGYANHRDYWEALTKHTPVNVLIGYSHAFIGGHFVFRLPGINEYLNRSLATHSLHDELYLARHISSGMAIFLSVLSVLVVAAMLLLVISFFRRFKTIRKASGGIIMPLLLCGAIYSVFFTFWMPEILEFWIFQTVLLWLILLGTLPLMGLPRPLKPAGLVLFMGASLFVINYLGSIHWLEDLNNDWYYTKVEPIKDSVTKNDVVLLQNGWILKDFVEYFTKADVQEVPPDDSTGVTVNKAINECLQRGGRLFIYPKMNNGQNAPQHHYIDSLLLQYNDRKTVLKEADPVIYLIK